MESTDAAMGTPSERVIRAVAASRDVAPTDLPPLYETLDPGALDTFVADADPGSELVFEYEGLEVTIEVLTGEVTVDVGEEEAGQTVRE